VINGDCGGDGCGVVYEMAKNGSGAWTEQALRDLPQAVGGYSGPAPDPCGNLYATLYSAGTEGYGVIRRLTKSSTTPWPATVLYSFNGGSNGGYPSAGPTIFRGSLFGSTAIGGILGDCT